MNLQILHLLSLEWKKFRKNKLVLLLLGLYTFLMPFAIFVMDNYIQMPGMPAKEAFFSFPGIWEYQGYSGSWFSFLFLGFIGVVIITSEVSNKTMRQNILTGMTRRSFYLGKLYVILTVGIWATLIYILSTILIGIFRTEAFKPEMIFEGHRWIILRYFVMNMGYLSFGLFLGMILRRSGLAIFTYLAYIIFLEPMIRWAIHRNIYEHRSMNFYPMNAIEDLMPNPAFKVIDGFKNMTNFELLLSFREAALISVLSIGVFFLISYLNLIRKDM